MYFPNRFPIEIFTTFLVMKTTIALLPLLLAVIVCSCGGETPQKPPYTFHAFYANGATISDSLDRFLMDREVGKIIAAKGIKEKQLKVYTSLRADIRDVLRPQLSLMEDEVYENINWKNPKMVEQREDIEGLRKAWKFFDAALVAIDNRTGQVVAHFSTYGDAQSDGVTRLSSIGSLQQTFSFAQGMQQEYTPFDVYPRFDRFANRVDPNFKTPFYQALEMASPTYAQGLDRRYTVAQSAQFLRKLSIRHGDLNDPIFRFKTTMSLLDVTKAYSAFYNKGQLHQPFYIDSITDHNGKLLYKHTVQTKRALDEETADEIMRILSFQYYCDARPELYNERDVPEFIGQFKALEARFNGSGWFIAITDDYTIGVRSFAAKKEISYPKKARSIQLRDRTFPLWHKTLQRLRKDKKEVPAMRKFDLSEMESYW